jgi:hypothetical protein
MNYQIDTEPLTRQLVQQAQLISQIRHDLDQLASEITDAYADLLSRFESLDPQRSARSATPTAWCWRTLGEQGAGELWSQLEDWVAWIRHRYPLAKKIPPCWPEHPEVVEELTALWLAWQAAYEQPDTQLTAAADWHDRWLPGFLHRLEHGTHAINCSETHHPRPIAAYSLAPGGECRRPEE